MNAIPAQEIKRRGIAAVDDLIAKGDLHVIRNNQPQYVVLSVERYQDLIVAEQEAHYARVRASLEDVKGGKVKKFKTAAALLKALDTDETACCTPSLRRSSFFGRHASFSKNTPTCGHALPRCSTTYKKTRFSHIWSCMP